MRHGENSGLPGFWFHPCPPDTLWVPQTFRWGKTSEHLAWRSVCWKWLSVPNFMWKFKSHWRHQKIPIQVTGAYMFACTHGCVYTWMCVHVHSWRPEADFCCLPQTLSTILFEAESPSGTWNSVSQQTDSQQGPRILLSSPPQCWDHRQGHNNQTSIWMLGIRLKSLCLHGRNITVKPSLQELN